MEMSLDCFRLGLLSFVPFLGLPLAVRSLRYFLRVHCAQADLWNPARGYWLWGGCLTVLGLLISQLVPIALVILGLAANYLRNNP
jgi:hypothetical protein